MVTRYTGTDTFLTPTVFRFIDPTKSSFILEHQANFLAPVDIFKLFYCGVIFLRQRFLPRWPSGQFNTVVISVSDILPLDKGHYISVSYD